MCHISDPLSFVSTYWASDQEIKIQLSGVVCIIAHSDFSLFPLPVHTCSVSRTVTYPAKLMSLYDVSSESHGALLCMQPAEWPTGTYSHLWIQNDQPYHFNSFYLWIQFSDVLFQQNRRTIRPPLSSHFWTFIFRRIVLTVAWKRWVRSIIVLSHEFKLKSTIEPCVMLTQQVWLCIYPCPPLSAGKDLPGGWNLVSIVSLFFWLVVPYVTVP